MFAPEVQNKKTADKKRYNQPSVKKGKIKILQDYQIDLQDIKERSPTFKEFEHNLKAAVREAVQKDKLQKTLDPEEYL